jgi:ADP-heptose:LPS heptosyltransferase
LSALGDVVHVTPCLKAIRQFFPSAEICMAVERHCAAIVRHSPYVDTLIEARPCNTRRLLPLLFRYFESMTHFRGRTVDVAIDFQGTRKSAVWVYASGSAFKAGRGEKRPGWAVAFEPDPRQHDIRVCCEIDHSIGIPVIDPNPEIFLSSEKDGELVEILDAVGMPREGFILMNPFSLWPSKAWPLERYAELMHLLHHELHLPMVITGGPGEEGQARRLMQGLRPGVAVSLVGKLTLEQALCLYRRGVLMVTGDSGPMHAAAALGTRVVALFGPTHPERTGPWGDKHTVIQELRPPSHHAYRSDHDGVYMRAIGVDQVYRAVRTALTGTAS